MAKPFVDGVGDDIREAYEDVRVDDSETNWWAKSWFCCVYLYWLQFGIIYTQKPQTVKPES